MNKFKLVLSTCLLVCSSSALAAEIFKWTDDEGNVHYGDRPTGELAGQAEPQTVTIASARTNPERVRENVAARQERDAARADARSAAAQAAEDAAQARADEEKRAQDCQKYRARLESFLTSRRLYRVDENGERSYLDEVQMQEARAKTQQQVEDACAS